jgi:hypothetical protein
MGIMNETKDLAKLQMDTQHYLSKKAVGAELQDRVRYRSSNVGKLGEPQVAGIASGFYCVQFHRGRGAHWRGRSELENQVKTTIFFWVLMQCCLIALAQQLQREDMSLRKPCPAITSSLTAATWALFIPLYVFADNAEGYYDYCHARGER